MAGRGHVEPLKGVRLIAGAKLVKPADGIGELGHELRGDFSTNFVATGADCWAEGREQIGRIGSQLHLHFADSFDDDALQSAAPARMDGRDGALLDVDQEDWDAVSGLDSEEETPTISHGGIALRRLGRSGIDHVDHVGVELFEGHQKSIFYTKGGLEAAAIFENIRTGIPFGETEIKNALAFEKAFPTGAGAEAMHKPGEFCEGGHLKDAETSRIESGPRMSSRRSRGASAIGVLPRRCIGCSHN